MMTPMLNHNISNISTIGIFNCISITQYEITIYLLKQLVLKLLQKLPLLKKFIKILRKKFLLININDDESSNFIELFKIILIILFNSEYILLFCVVFPKRLYLILVLVITSSVSSTTTISSINDISIPIIPTNRINLTSTINPLIYTFQNQRVLLRTSSTASSYTRSKIPHLFYHNKIMDYLLEGRGDLNHYFVNILQKILPTNLNNNNNNKKNTCDDPNNRASQLQHQLVKQINRTISSKIQNQIYHLYHYQRKKQYAVITTPVKIPEKSIIQMYFEENKIYDDTTTGIGNVFESNEEFIDDNEK
ncbi:hypothetical protein Glove_469g18 [Diversispora epigaea]|uniref:Uncharacterized protein n=1 Tax=Diversispora epigaea TaxID=1348612 RepID=A0A397GRZ0_9GLOM|nr:hypothetical protein Glove_469g18 [Diversispora epigaea]